MKLFVWLKATHASKRFFTQFLMYSWHEAFLSLTVFAFEGKENALLFCHDRQFFFQAAIIFATNFCELVHRKTFVLPTDCCFWKKDLKIKPERIRSHWRQKKSRISEDFLDLSMENRKFRRYCTVCLFGQWNQSKEFSKQLSFSGSKVHPLKRNIKDRQRVCFLFVDWAIWKFFFFVEEMFRFSIVFFLAFKRTLLIELLSQKNESKSNNETNFVLGQKIRGKSKKLQYGWVSECWLWYDIGWALKVIANETQVLRTSPDT